MINIKSDPKKFSIKIILYLIISILIFICTSKITFSMGLSKNIKDLSFPEEELSIKYCDAINKSIFNGLNDETLLKYEYYFSSLKSPYNKDPNMILQNFELNVKKNCSYELKEVDKLEFLDFIKRYVKNTS